ncbi:hypothetical protein DFH09DRAFT_1075489 [Mycena vulgaris]|nr:hypothetical protein DFH09DRAFT_1075489 [Mycena vulgaris]
MQDSTSQLTASILLGSLSLIPNTALRYTALGLATCLGVLYAVYLKHPSTQLRQLETMLATTEELIRGAKAQCPRDQLSLAEEWIRFLEVKHSASVIKYNILDTPRLTWTKYRLLSKDMTEHIIHVKSIHTAVQLTIEAERQRNLTAEIDDAEFILCSSGYRGFPNSTDPSPYNSAYSDPFSCITPALSYGPSLYLLLPGADYEPRQGTPESVHGVSTLQDTMLLARKGLEKPTIFRRVAARNCVQTTGLENVNPAQDREELSRTDENLGLWWVKSCCRRMRGPMSSGSLFRFVKRVREKLEENVLSCRYLEIRPIKLDEKRPQS